MKQFWIDFAEGRITVPQMLERTEAEPALLDWFNTIVPEGKVTGVVHKETDETGYTRYYAENVPFTVQIMLREELAKGGRSNLAHALNIHSCLSYILEEAFPEDGIVIDETLNNKFDFMLDACPEAVEGVEVEQVIEDLLESLPTELSKAKRVKLFKEKVKEVFPTAAGKWPRWVQGGEWPLGANGKPMRFVEQKRKKGKEYANMLYTQYFFEDVDTGETRVIDQYT